VGLLLGREQWTPAAHTDGVYQSILVFATASATSSFWPSEIQRRRRVRQTLDYSRGNLLFASTLGTATPLRVALLSADRDKFGLPRTSRPASKSVIGRTRLEPTGPRGAGHHRLHFSAVRRSCLSLSGPHPKGESPPPTPSAPALPLPRARRLLAVRPAQHARRREVRCIELPVHDANPSKVGLFLFMGLHGVAIDTGSISAQEEN